MAPTGVSGATKAVDGLGQFHAAVRPYNRQHVALTPGTRLGVYEITALLGEGGMGQVYRATDTRLKRQVAIKVLPAAVAADSERLSRFQREAEVLAALNHPHIAAIYGLEEHAGVSAIVMELVEGEDLSQRIARGPIPIDEALPIARQIADALAAAHEQGIIHRDLKPANIKVRADGTVKVLDFGLAKALAPASASDAAAAGAAAATITSPAMTQPGVILGTAAYMSPEQARGKLADKRADIWSFGVVLWEMLTGARLFAGATVPDTLASILTAEPPWGVLAPTTPAAIRRVLRRCLERNHTRRLADIADVRLELDDAVTDDHVDRSAAPVVVPPRARVTMAWAAALVCAATALGMGIALLRRPAEVVTPVYRSTVVVNESLAIRAPSQRFRLSPDGRRLAYVALDQSGRTMLFVRALDSLAGQPLAGTDDATAPFWSPDSRVIAFFADEKLKRIDAGGGPVTVICDAPAPTARRVTPGSWSRDDVILMSSPTSMTIAQVAAGGGTPSAATTLDAGRAETQHGFPFFLPGGRRFLYVAYNGLVPLGLYVGSLDGQAPVRVMDTESDAQYAGGSLLFVRSATLMRQPFDPATLALTGEAVVLGERVLMNATFMRAGAFSVSENGALVYQGFGGAGTARLVWSDRAGRQTAIVDERLQYRDLHLSPDGTRAVVSVVSVRENNSDVWVVDVGRGQQARFTFDATDDLSAIWSPQGTDVAFSSRRKGKLDLYRKSVGGADREEVLLDDPVDKTPTSWSSDGKFILYSINSARTGPDVWVLPLTGDRKSFPFLETTTDERFARFSPDGHWVAYMSSESGRSDVYVTRFPGPGGKRQVSRAGGHYPRWRSDGKELFYLSPDNRLMAASVTVNSDRVEVGAVQPLFEMRAPEGLGLPRDFYDVASDGQRFMLVVPDETTSTPLTLVTNWPAIVNNRR